MKKCILIVEDEKNIVDILRFNLQREGYETVEAFDGEQGLQLALEQDPSLILLDVMLPKMDGFAVCQAIRDQGYTTPIIMLTAREEETDKVLGLELGADDYITKPFSMRELLARVKANIRRTVMEPLPSNEKGHLVCGPLEIDEAARVVYKNGVMLELTAREYDLLFFLAKEAGTVFSREDLMTKVWNYDYIGDVRTVDVAVRRLRGKIEDHPAQPTILLTRRGAGYLVAKTEMNIKN
ncbi:MAG: response regulator transcription factor [Oscillospiraceae bacterium]|nr:response regulator transcription factor [Oscillospiraceae bacterium]